MDARNIKATDTHNVPKEHGANTETHDLRVNLETLDKEHYASASNTPFLKKPNVATPVAVYDKP